MTTVLRRFALLAVGLIAIGLAAVGLSGCGNSGDGLISVRDVWANATPTGASVAAVYLEVTADAKDTLLSATTTVADRIEMHASSEENGMMRMRPLETVELKAGETFAFAPSGAHFMLLGLRQPLVAGMRFPLTLQFKNAGTLTAQVEVVELGSR